VFRRRGSGSAGGVARRRQSWWPYARPQVSNEVSLTEGHHRSAVPAWAFIRFSPRSRAKLWRRHSRSPSLGAAPSGRRWPARCMRWSGCGARLDRRSGRSASASTRDSNQDGCVNHTATLCAKCGWTEALVREDLVGHLQHQRAVLGDTLRDLRKTLISAFRAILKRGLAMAGDPQPHGPRPSCACKRPCGRSRTIAPDNIR
jgi:hypothetical protein